MEYYNTKGELVTFRKEKYKTEGKSAEIYQIKKDFYLKKYKKETSRTARMDYDVFRILKKLNHPFTNQVLELLHETGHVYNKEKLILYPDSFQTDAYTYLYLKDRNIDIVKKSVDYFLYNVEKLEELMDIFTEYYLVASDLRRKNAVYNGDKIVLLDLDCCKIQPNRKKEEIQSLNKTELRNLLESLLLWSKSTSYEYQEAINKLILGNKENVTNELKRRLINCRTPFDYIKRNWQK